MISIERITEPTPELRELIGELDAVLNAAYEPHQRHGLAIAQLFEPHVRFFVVRLDGAPVACGGVALFDDYAEVKRMYTRDAVRGHGVGKALLLRLEQEARAAGRDILRLETGTLQDAAIGLYERCGFRRCAVFGPYAELPPHRIVSSIFYEKTLP